MKCDICNKEFNEKEIIPPQQITNFKHICYNCFSEQWIITNTILNTKEAIELHKQWDEKYKLALKEFEHSEDEHCNKLYEIDSWYFEEIKKLSASKRKEIVNEEN
jgi:hypothetical protein